MTDLTAPSSYSGLYGFHKYWGKKPVELLRALISVLSDVGDIVADPFLGSGAIAKEATLLDRRFLGSDINPIAVQLASFNLNPCSSYVYERAFTELTRRVKDRIIESYDLPEFGVTSHVLWQEGVIESVWQRPVSGSRRRVERSPTESDYQLSARYEGYKPKLLRPLTMFHNSRINSTIELDWARLFSGRALRNLEIILEEIRAFPEESRLALELTLTASIGQMSRMVFAITSRGKTTGTSTGKTEVGSWVIGFWRPKQHFEINVWNCFESRANKLLKALPKKCENVKQEISIAKVLQKESGVHIARTGALSFLSQIPDESLQLVITDPPHGDRIPYLELSEIWNAVLGEVSNLDDEVVVSNAKKRAKTLDTYNFQLTEILKSTARKVRSGGFIVLLFNSRSQREWKALEALGSAAGVALIGSMPLNYSARSVVQDNREGAMKTDFVVVYGKGIMQAEKIRQLASVPDWVDALPSDGA
jgi:16S rRNA G966 N2-methylase RsmD